MRAKDYLILKNFYVEKIALYERQIDLMKNCLEFPDFETLRKATKYDVRVGNIFYYFDGDEGKHWHEIIEVYRPDDDFKAYCGEDGCRYGLDGAFVGDAL